MTLVVAPTLSVLVSVWMETLCYGINVVIYGICLFIFLSNANKQGDRARTIVLVMSTLLFAAATAHVAVNLRRLIEGFVLPATKIDMLKFLIDVTAPTDIAKQYLVVIVNLLSDALITWRVHVVWGYRWRITLIPLFLCLSVFAIGLASITTIAVSKPGSSIFQTGTNQLGTTMMALSLVMNVTSTFLIASRIWWVTREVTLAYASPSNPGGKTTFGPRVGGSDGNQWKKRNPQYWRLVVLIIESASLAAFVQILLLSFYTAKFPAVYFVADTSVQTAAMSPLLIIAFVGLLNRRTSSNNWSNFTSYQSYSENDRVHAVRRPGDGSSSRTAGASGRGRVETQLSEMKFQTRSASLDSRSETMNFGSEPPLDSPVTSVEKGKHRDIEIVQDPIAGNLVPNRSF
ncbi:hypothetical protein M378DRAFT_161927 [Amanita muscaria Koide BX008]|uniref:Uncharacterized protein n=1 Tax=Amanita muscaria (strain Koide BX008) TaxID=946122 RepID=A0A0C2X8I9_AMAMK|nr:hypothetical protein M378DRAFT_161927 [Amanita muscaria Koide BX008]